MASILVVGGAGYIGSHMMKLLLKQGHHPVAFDNLSSGHETAVLDAKFYRGDLANKDQIVHCFTQNDFAAVMHFAGLIAAPESVQQPALYYRENLLNSLNLLDVMRQFGCNKLIFSSSAAVYGNPHHIPMGCSHPCQPLTPYGRSKLIVEQMLRDFDQAYGLRFTSLRYFNVAGADPESKLGERHDPETHLIPIALQVAAGIRDNLTIFGADYATPDGTCIRDYIHVLDLCTAHLLALQALLSDAESCIYNVGIGRGYSVKDVIKAVNRITKVNISTITAAKRPGDPATLIADSSLIQEQLGWKPNYPELEIMIRHAWQWEMMKNSGVLTATE